jgi:23S rRNA (guanosine2251-2'-O)-methyltransferase
VNNSLIVIAHNLRSAHNVGSLIRTCEGLGVHKLFLTGYTPYPAANPDKRLPHLARRIEKQITKTSLGAEKSLEWEHSENVKAVLDNLSLSGYQVAALEQYPKSKKLNQFKSNDKLAILLGNEVTGIPDDLLTQADIILEIPMAGRKESFNVVEATTMAIYHCRYLA